MYATVIVSLALSLCPPLHLWWCLHMQMVQVREIIRGLPTRPFARKTKAMETDREREIVSVWYVYASMHPYATNT